MPLELLDLPHELLSLVAEQLYDPRRLADLKNLRLVSRECRELGIEHLFSYKAVDMTDLDEFTRDSVETDFPRMSMRQACRTLHFVCHGVVGRRIYQPWWNALTLVRKAFPDTECLKLEVSGFWHPEDTIALALKPFSPGSNYRAIDIVVRSERLEVFDAMGKEIRHREALASFGSSILTYLRVEASASQAFFQLCDAKRSDSPLFGALTTFSLNNDPDVQDEQVDRFLETCPTITKLSVLGCLNLLLAPLLTSIEKHLGRTLVSLRIGNWDLSGADTPAESYSFPSLERLSIEDGDGYVELNKEIVDLITVHYMLGVSAPNLVHINLSYRLGFAGDDADRALRQHLSSPKRFPALRHIYFYSGLFEIDDSRRAAWCATEASSLYAIHFDSQVEDAEGIFGAGLLPRILSDE